MSKNKIESGPYAGGHYEIKYVSVNEDWSPCFNSSKRPRKNGQKSGQVRVRLLVSSNWNKVSVMGADDTVQGLWTKDKNLAQNVYFKIQDGITKEQLIELGVIPE